MEAAKYAVDINVSSSIFSVESAQVVGSFEIKIYFRAKGLHIFQKSLLNLLHSLPKNNLIELLYKYIECI